MINHEFIDTNKKAPGDRSFKMNQMRRFKVQQYDM